MEAPAARTAETPAKSKKKRKSVKEMKETIKGAGYLTDDIFERLEIEQRYADALERLAEAEWMNSSAAVASSGGDDDGPLIPPATAPPSEPDEASGETLATASPDNERALRKLARRVCVVCGHRGDASESHFLLCGGLSCRRRYCSYFATERNSCAFLRAELLRFPSRGRTSRAMPCIEKGLFSSAVAPAGTRARSGTGSAGTRTPSARRRRRRRTTTRRIARAETCA